MDGYPIMTAKEGFAMKKLLCVVFLLVSLVFCVSVDAESSSASVNHDVVQAMLESALENGFSSHKDLQAMLDNALLNGYDYFDVRYNETSNSFWIEVAIDGFASALSSLENSKSEDAAKNLMQAKETIISHCNAILDLFEMVGHEDINFIFEIVDDDPLFEYGMAEMNLIVIRVFDGKSSVLTTQIDAWKESQ